MNFSKNLVLRHYRNSTYIVLVFSQISLLMYVGYRDKSSLFLSSNEESKYRNFFFIEICAEV